MSTRKRILIDWWARQIFRAAGMLTIGLLGGILLMLIAKSIGFFVHVYPVEFIGGTKWNPAAAKPNCGILPLLASTGLVALGSMCIAVPLGIFTAASNLLARTSKMDNALYAQILARLQCQEFDLSKLKRTEQI